MEDYLTLVADVGFPIVGAGAAGYFVYLTLKHLWFSYYCCGGNGLLYILYMEMGNGPG